MSQASQLHRNKARGCLLGLAVGDALGTTIEFSKKDSTPPLTGIVGGGPFGLKAGQWTDDTSMALCLADSLIACERTDLTDQIERYVRWWVEGENSATGKCFDIGMTVSSALDRYLTTKDPMAGERGEFSAGNGSLMRLAPTVLFHAPWKHIPVERCVKHAGLSSITTHQEARAVDGCRAAAFILYQLLDNQIGMDKRVLLEKIASSSFIEDLHPDIQQVVRGSYQDKTRDQIFGSGYVVHSLEAALWSFYHSEDFRSGALLAANLGDDADTTAAIYGQFAGAYYGESGLPADWLALLAWRSHISERADKLAAIQPLPADTELASFIATYEQCNRARMDADIEKDEVFNPLTQSAYDNGLILPGFNWSHWQNGEDAINDLTLIERFDLRGCCQLITAVIRSIKFSGASLDHYHDVGVISQLINVLGWWTHGQAGDYKSSVPINS